MKNKIILSTFLILTCLISNAQTQGVVQIESSPAIKAVINNKINYNRSNPEINGYRIQIYNGSESGANNLRGKFNALFPNTTTSVDWDSPEWKVRVGKYTTKLKVEKALEEIKLVFGNAFILPLKIRM